MDLLFAVLLSVTTTRSTLCQTGDEQVFRNVPVQRLLGCGTGFPDNVLWHLDRADSRSGALDASTYTPATGRGVVVYVIDMATRREHVEFMRAEGSIVIDEIQIGGIPVGGCPGTGPCSTGASHGTAVTGVIAGANVGIAPDVRIVSIVAGPSRYFEAFRAIVQHAYSAAAPPFRTAVINISGGYSSDFTEYDRMRQEVAMMTAGVDASFQPDPNGKRFVFAVAAGNGAVGNFPSGCGPGNTVTSYPGLFGAEIDGLITVGAIDRNNNVWEHSCGGSSSPVEVLAPAVDMFLAAATANDHYLDEPAPLSGTSFAAPYVAGMAARILERAPDLTPAQVEARLKAPLSHADELPVPVTPRPFKRRAVR